MSSSPSTIVCQEAPGAVSPYDVYAQCLAKIERSHSRDLNDIREMIARWNISTLMHRQRYRIARDSVLRDRQWHGISGSDTLGNLNIDLVQSHESRR